TGWTILSHFKQNPESRHIPVQIVTVEEERQHGLARGAYAYLNKSASSDRIGEALADLRRFVEPRRRRLLIIENPQTAQHGMVELLSYEETDIVVATDAESGLATLRASPFDCVALDLLLPHESGFELLAE